MILKKKDSKKDKPSKKSNKKNKYIPKTGITGVGEDYHIYKMTFKDTLIGFFLGFLAGFAGSYVMFGVIIASLIFGVIVGFVAIPIYNKYLLNKRKRILRLEFRDLLDSLSNSFSAGKNTIDAFSDAYTDLNNSLGSDANMVKELNILINGLHNNYVIEDLLMDMSNRMENDDIRSFAETFAVCNRLGGNLKKIVSDSRDIINEKIEIEMEIQTTLSSNRNEMNIMCVMPFIVVAMMRTLGEQSISVNSPLNIIVKFFAIGLFILAYIVGRKITDIRI